MENFDKFILALNAKKKITVNFKIDPSSALISRKCIPVDYYRYVKEGGHEEGYAYRVWDCQDGNMTTLSLRDSEIEKIDLLEEKFYSNEFKDMGFSNVRSLFGIVSVFTIILFVFLLYFLIQIF